MCDRAVVPSRSPCTVNGVGPSRADFDRRADHGMRDLLLASLPGHPMTTPRIAPGGLRDIGLINNVICAGGAVVTKGNKPNLFTTLGKHRGLFRGWLWFSSKLMPFGVLRRRETELVILRVAHLRACEYEFHHHVHLGRRAGVTGADVERVKIGPDAEGWSPRERVLLRAVQALHERQDIDDATWGAMRAELSEKECIEAVLLVGQYEMLATAVKALRIQPDEFRG